MLVSMRLTAPSKQRKINDAWSFWNWDVVENWIEVILKMLNMECY
jgi:hypothetical protein